jgi:hypothetical protein
MVIATGVFKRVSIKKQIGLGTPAPAGPSGSAQYLRRVTSTLDLTKAAYTSAEILVSQQRRDMRHGVRSVTGTISGELSVGAYQLPMESVLRQVSQVGATTGALATSASSGAGTFAGTFTRSAGSYLTDGFKVGDVVRFTGWAAPALANNAINYLITALTATVMTVRTLNQTDIVAKAAGDSVTVSLAGKKTWVPQSGQSRDYYTIEQFFSDISISERFTDCVFADINLTFPASGMATVNFPVMGINAVTGNAEYFTTPAAQSVGPILASVNGALLVNGVVVAAITSFTLSVKGNYAGASGVVGSNTEPDIFPGVMDTTGSATVLFSDAVMRDLFYNETESSISVVLTGDNTPNAPIFAVNLPRVKFSGATKDDHPLGLAQTMPFTALENYAGGAGTATLATSISIQDSMFI